MQSGQPLAAQVSRWLCSIVPEEVVAEPGKLLNSALAVSERSLGETSTPESRLLLVALLAQRAIDDSEWEWTGDSIPSSALREELPRLHVILAARDRWPLQRLVARTARFLCVVAWIDRFSQAIAPRALHSLVRDAALAGRRLRHYLGSRKSSDAEVRLRASVELDRLEWPEQYVGSFLDWLPAARLRTYPADMLCRVAEHWRTWSPLVHRLRGVPQVSDDVEARLRNEVLGRVLYLLPRALAGTPWFGRDDAVQEAILSEIQAPADREDDYCYEVEYPLWLARGATNRLRSRQRLARTQELQEDRASAPETAEALGVERGLEWRSRIALVLTFFQPQVRCRVKALVTWAFLNSSDSARLKRDAGTVDAGLAAYVEQTCREEVPLKTLAVTRYRLRQRLEVLRLLRDHADRVAAPPVDAAVRAWIEERWGWADADEPTLRHLAALARAAAVDRNLGWALFARLLMDSNNHDTEKTFAELGELLRHAGPGKDEIDRRLALARRWQMGAPARRAWTAIRNEVRGDRMSFLLSPCWLLVVLRGLEVEQVIEILLPRTGERGGAEEGCIRKVVAALSRERA
jgi:hypothetical protein